MATRTAFIYVTGLGPHEREDVCKETRFRSTYSLNSASLLFIFDVEQVSYKKALDYIGLINKATKINKYDIIPMIDDVKKIYKSIVKCMRMAEYEHVIIIGTSYGALVSCMALMKVLEHHRKYTDKLTFYTIGSPTIIPKNILPAGHMVNFYHVKDPLIRRWLVLVEPFTTMKLPRLRYYQTKMKKENVTELFDAENSVMYIGKDKVAESGYYPMIEKDALVPNIDFFTGKNSKMTTYHANPFLLYPVIDVNVAFEMVYKLYIGGIFGKRCIALLEEVKQKGNTPAFMASDYKRLPPLTVRSNQVLPLK